MRILFVHECFGALAGAEANVLTAASGLKALGHEVAILHGEGTGKSEEAWCGTFEHRFAINDPKASVTEAVMCFSPDVVYVHKMADMDVLEALVESGVPLVRMVHDHDIYCMRSYKYNYFTRTVCQRPASGYCVFPCLASVARNRGGGFPLRWLSYSKKKREIALNRHFHRHLVVSEYMRQELIRNRFDDRKIEIHPPIPKMGDATIRSNFSDRNLLLYVGQIIRGKGVDVLLKALAQVDERFECVILGEGGHRPACERLCRKLGLDDRVSFMGFVPQEQLKDYYRECTATLLSSVWPEPIATVGLEVMRYGLPVVAFDAGGIKDWLHDGHNGFLVPWMDTTAFAGAVTRLLQDKDLARRLGENGQRLVNERYDFDHYLQNLVQTFQTVAEEQRGVEQKEIPR